MRVLALDTSSPACSVALADGDAIAERHEVRPREHTRILVPMIRDLLADAGIAPAALDAIVLGNGPGSFIGVRIGAAVAQGLAYGAGVGIIPVSSLAAIAAEVFATQDAGTVLVAQDAHLGEVYLGEYRRDGDHNVMPVRAEYLHAAEGRIDLQADAARPVVGAGFGWQRYPALADANRESLDVLAPVEHPRARFLLGLGLAGDPASRAVDPRAVEPAYLRETVARKPGSAP
ncbi:MAG: tRNA (adenosine(37)-N6)-threonylcarbamoyltransferase complex dimerization subunit type 1 TsaB [Woeseiaceae bacterium]|nr:tRNA (adenosine(37)-N6)-threonylcarbamoyltransferase complex dimerization subunit type 1 TsaB [Woeseiaceae bacterium]